MTVKIVIHDLEDVNSLARFESWEHLMFMRELADEVDPGEFVGTSIHRCADGTVADVRDFVCAHCGTHYADSLDEAQQ